LGIATILTAHAPNPFPFHGLTDAEVLAARAQHGRNTIEDKTDGTFWPALKGAVLEPMFLLLLATSIIYFVLGQRTEAYFMAGAIVLVSTISIYQDARSRKALSALRAFSEAQAKVIRNNTVVKVPVEDLLLGINCRWKRWSGALAYQHVLDQGNANGFLRNVWDDTEKAQGYFEAYQL